MCNSKYVNEFIDWLSTNIQKPINITAKSIIDHYKQSYNDCINFVKELVGGCTNSSVVIEFRDNVKVKLSVYDTFNSPYRILEDDQFLKEKQIKNSLYLNEFGIIYNVDSSVIVSEYIEGESFNDLLIPAINSKNLARVVELNNKVVESITEFHKSNKVKTHCTTLSSIAMMFYRSLKEVVLDKELFKEEYESLNKILTGIQNLLLFESSFNSDDFVLCHFDTDPVNMIFCDNKVKLIDFEFTGVGLKYYDYANYLNALSSLHCGEYKKNNFVDYSTMVSYFYSELEEVIPNFKLNDFESSFDIIRFVWGIWYIMYGLKNNLKNYVEIGNEWISDWIENNREDVL